MYNVAILYDVPVIYNKISITKIFYNKTSVVKEKIATKSRLQKNWQQKKNCYKKFRNKIYVVEIILQQNTCDEDSLGLPDASNLTACDPTAVDA